MSDYKKQIGQILNTTYCLTVYRDIFSDPVLSNYKELLGLVAGEKYSAVEQCFAFLDKLLALPAEGCQRGIDIFRDHLLNTLVGQENSFSLAAESKNKHCFENLLVNAVKNDLSLLQRVYEFDLLILLKFIEKQYSLFDIFPPFDNFYPDDSDREEHSDYYRLKKAEVKKILSLSSKWSNEVETLHAFYNSAGSGIFGRYWAFRWNARGKGSGLCGIARPDPIKIDDLVGYEDQKKEIIRNTRQFIAGLGANNILLYGDRGTGKSSTIKSLVHIFGADGLRIVEVSKHDLLSLHAITLIIDCRPQKFIIFIDDLSFEEDETIYKELKALLEGSIAKPPENVLVYATSNRRNLVREYFRDRLADEVGSQDTYQEKLSLADRFGIKLVYSAPGKDEYLRTVEEMAQKNGIAMGRAELHELALRWVLWHNARSGRTAKQFINDLKGKLGILGMKSS